MIAPRRHGARDAASRAAESVRHVRLPADRFYWALLDAAMIPPAARASRRRLHEGLGFLLESKLPGLEIEQMQAVYRPLPGAGDRYVACAIARSDLDESIDARTLSVAPQNVPAFIEAEVEPDSLNMLTGDYLPAPLRRANRRMVVETVVAIFVCAVLVVVGFERRNGAARETIETLKARQADLARQVLGSEAISNGLPPSMQLLAERRRLERTRAVRNAPAELPDSSTLVTQILGVWPRDVHAMTESVNVTAESINIRASVPSMVDAQRFADAFAELPGWRLLQPQTQSQRGAVMVIVRLTDAESSP